MGQRITTIILKDDYAKQVAEEYDLFERTQGFDFKRFHIDQLSLV